MLTADELTDLTVAGRRDGGCGIGGVDGYNVVVVVGCCFCG